jgi:hypothetical protein
MVGKTPRARALPQVEELEPREVPSTVAALPADWLQWSTNGSPVFALSPAPGAPHGLAAAAGRTSLGGRAWPRTSRPADVQVSASVYLGTLIPAQILARGRALDTAAPTYYALSLTRGLHLQLLRVVRGSATRLADVQSAGYFSGQ